MITGSSFLHLILEAGFGSYLRYSPSSVPFVNTLPPESLLEKQGQSQLIQALHKCGMNWRVKLLVIRSKLGEIIP
jgi:hypothetical protein